MSKSFALIALLFCNVLVSCQNNTSTTETNDEPTTQLAASDTTTTTTSSINPLTIDEVQKFIAIAEEDLAKFPRITNSGVNFRNDPICGNRTRAYSVNFGVKKLGGVQVKNKKGQSYPLKGTLYVSRVNLSLYSYDSLTLEVFTSGYVEDVTGEDISTSTNSFDNRWIQVQQTSNGWVVTKVGQSNPMFEYGHWNDPTPYTEPQVFELTFAQELPAELQARLQAICEKFWIKAKPLVTKCSEKND